MGWCVWYYFEVLEVVIYVDDVVQMETGDEEKSKMKRQAPLFQLAGWNVL
jgi:hypothetical protein